MFWKLKNLQLVVICFEMSDFKLKISLQLYLFKKELKNSSSQNCCTSYITIKNTQ